MINMKYKNSNNIEDRLDYIFKTIFDTCGFKLENWYVEGAREGELGDVSRLISRDFICFGKVNYTSNKIIIPTKNFKAILFNEEWDLLHDIPIEWLDEDFEDQLKEGLELYKKTVKVQKIKSAQKRSENKLRKEKLIQSAKSKLTIEEQKAVGIYRR